MRYMNRKALMALGILIGATNAQAMKKQLDSYSMMIVAKHLKSEKDYKNLMQVCKKFKKTSKKFRYNPISITEKTKIFPYIDTHVIYDDDEEISDDFDKVTHTKRITMSERVRDYRNNHYYKNILLDRRYMLQPIFVEKDGVVTINGARQPIGVERSIFDQKITKLVIGSDTVNPTYERGDNIREFYPGLLSSAFNIKAIEIKPSIRKIDQSALSNCGIEEIVLHNGLAEICGFAFLNCVNLTNLVLPDSVSILNSLALVGCSNLREITLSSSMTSLAKSVFKNSVNLAKVSIPESIVDFGDSCFEGCGQLTEIVLPSRVQTVGYQAFYMCTSLSKLSFNSDVNFMPSSINECNNLRQLITPSGWRLYVYKLPYQDKVLLSNGTKIQAIGVVNKHAIDGLNVINDDTYPCCRLNNQSDVLNILEGIQEIDKYTFSICGVLTSITLPDSVTKIGGSAFEKCFRLRSVNIGQNVRQLDFSAFESCTRLKSVTITDNVSKLCSRTFYKCSNLTNIILPISLREIEANCFSFCEALRGIVIPNNVSKMDGYTFAGCGELRFVQLPERITSIESFTFKGCSNLVNIEVPALVRYIDYGAFFLCTQLSKITLFKRRGEGDFRINNIFQTWVEIPDSNRKCVEIVEIDM